MCCPFSYLSEFGCSQPTSKLAIFSVDPELVKKGKALKLYIEYFWNVCKLFQSYDRTSIYFLLIFDKLFTKTL